MATVTDSVRSERPRRPAGVWALLVGLAFLGVSAMAGGAAFLLAPDGSVYGFSPDDLGGSPFSDFLVPGLVLFTVLGVYPLVVVWAVIRGRWWAWPAALSVGLALVVWLVVQAWVVGWGAALQWAYLGLGVVLLGLSLLPSVGRALDADDALARLG